MPERVPLHRSVFVRLFAVMVASALLLFVVVAGLFVAVIGRNLDTFRRIAADHARLLATTTLDEVHARDLSRRLDVGIRYEGPGGSWSTSPGLPSVAEAERANARGSALHLAADTMIVESPGGGRYLFAWGHERRLREAHDRYLVLALTLVLVVLIVAHEVIRRSLRPLRTLHAGVERLSAGELDVVLPSTSRDEFGALTEAFNAMVRRVREMVTARDRLLRDVSHELRSPLTRMKVALALLPEGEKPDQMRADVVEMETLVGELLELERLRDGRGLRLERHDLAPILRSVAESFQDAPPGVLVDVPADLPALVDADQLRALVRNLLENAVKYSLPDSAPVRLSAGREGPLVVLRVRDDGPGIPPADRGSLFEPFFRVDRSRSRKTGGYGLGLSICKRIAEAHGGGIELEDATERGVTFVVRLRDGG
jgi:signal transduction histidine kinase